ncbi:restin homolog isoform X3 [Diabrotica virgifera virgifera]|uniref:Restin homolog isoform X1 n=1 Tax=Diabrotica virgifera virgifera TaxID=50390 RepID=A0A6P7G7U0_DIAVI|nr:restin homolog isoform X3 [Diabrotica virgifera virgifera]
MSEVPSDNSAQTNNGKSAGSEIEQPPAGASSLSASVTSLDNVSVASSKLSKASGIRPPSKIGRLCGNQHKPSLPTTPTKNSSTILTEDTDSFIIGQKVWVSGTKPGHIAFIGETQFAPGEWAGIALEEPIGKNDGSVNGIRYFQCEPKKGVFSRLTRLTKEPLEGVSYATTPSPENVIRNSISPTGSTHGLLKSPVSVCGSNLSLISSASHVIDFKIGDRVIIKSSQGSKVGTVRYMGITEFAAGEWVGVELDDPRGKNDGSVNGKRYFECRPNFGLFAPITKVSKSPSKIKPGTCQVHGTGLPPSGIKRMGSKESLMSSMSTTSAASNARRVRLGLASLSPKKTTPKTSSTPIPTRTALQDVLKEKQQHIEQLLKEREEADHKLIMVEQEYKKYRDEHGNKLEQDSTVLNALRHENTQLASQLEEEKRKTEDIQFRLEETVIFKEDLETKDKSNVAKIKELQDQLTSEKQRIEALEADTNKLFEAEENLIKYKEEVETLRQELQSARNKEVILEGNSASTSVLIKSLQDEADQCKLDLVEKNNLINVLNNELEKTKADLTKQLEYSLVKFSQLEIVFNKKEEDLDKIKKEIEESSKLLEERSAELTKVVNEKFTAETNLEKELERVNLELTTRTNELSSLQSQLQDKDTSASTLQTDISSLQQLLKDKDVEKEELNKQNALNNARLEELTNALKTKESECNENQENFVKLKTEYDAITTQLSTLQSELNQSAEDKDGLLQSKNAEINKLNDTIKSKEEECLQVNSKHNTLQENHDKLTSELELLKSNLVTLEKQKQETQESKDTEIIELNNKLTVVQNEFSQQTYSYNELKTSFDKIQLELQNLQLASTDNKKQYEAEEMKANLKIKELSDSLSTKEIDWQNLTKESEAQKLSLESVKTELEQTKQAQEQILNEKNEKIKEMSTVIQENSATILSLQSQLEITKIDLESVSNNLQQYQTNLSDVESSLKKERDTIKEHLKDKVKELEDNKAEFASTLAARDSQIQEISTTLTNKAQEIENLKKEIGALVEKYESSNKEVVTSHTQEITARDEKIRQLESEILQKDQNIKIHVDASNEHQENLKIKDLDLVKIRSELEESQKTSSEIIATLKNQIEGLQSDNKQQQSRNNELQTELQNREQLNVTINTEMGKAAENLAVLVEQVKQKDELIESLRSDVKSREIELENVLATNLKALSEKNEAERQIRAEKEQLCMTIGLKNEELEDLQNRLTNMLCENEQVINEVNNNVSKKSEELETIKQQLSKAAIDHEDKLKQITEEHKKEMHDFEIRVSDLLTEIENRDKDISDLSQLVETSHNSSKEQDSKINSIVQELAESKSQILTQLDSNKKLSEDISVITNENKIIQEKLKEADKQIEILSTEKEKLNNELAAVIANSGDSSKKVAELTTVIKEKESAYESENTQHKHKLQELENALHALQKTNEELNGSAKKYKSDFDSSVKGSQQLQQQIETFKVELTKKTTEIETLQKNLKTANLAITEKDVQLSKLNNVSTNRVQEPPNDTNTDMKQLLEEKLFAENQVNFLNSIIADMQKKSEEQKARIEILEMGYSSTAADELASLGFKLESKQVPPRMYCDICEEFDLHETEDCPTQGDDEEFVHNSSPGTKQKPPQRDYCDVCEVFGHATEDCTEDQEF